MEGYYNLQTTTKIIHERVISANYESVYANVQKEVSCFTIKNRWETMV